MKIIAYEEFKDIIFAEAKAYGFSDFEIYYVESNSFTVKIFGGEVAEYKNTDTAGLSFRGTFNGRMGYAFTETLEQSIIPLLIKNAADNATIIEEEEIEKLYPGDPSYLKTNNYNPALNDTSIKQKIDLAMQMEKCAYEADPLVKSVDYCQLGTAEGTMKIANSSGINLSDRSNIAYAYLSARVEEDGITKTASEIWHGSDFSNFLPKEIAKAAAKRAISYLPAKSVQSGTYPIVFDNRTACKIMSAFSSTFFAEHAQKGFSLLLGKEGETIAANHITIRDDGIANYETFSQFAFDSEGVATKQKAIVQDGVLKTLLYNTKSAGKEGKQSTGNGFKGSFRASVATACTNFYIVPSDTTPQEMRKKIKRGILITEIAGLHAGINATSGDFSISSDGFLIEDGEITTPVEQITVAGNFYSLLKDIECVANDLKFGVPSSGGTFGMPSILVRELPVSGL